MANDGVLVVNFGALEQAKGDIRKALSSLESQLSQLERDAGPLVATWDGAAKTAYADRQRKWTNAAAELKTTLHQILGAVEDSSADYLNTEKKATSLFQ